MKIVFFLGSVDISGGSYVIYQHALYAHRHGHDVYIVAQQPFLQQQLKWHPATSELKVLYIDEIPPDMCFDLAIATWWKTAIELHRLKAHQYAYFVQSIESRFYPEHEKPLRDLVDTTYKLPLPGITEATWIRGHLKCEYDQAYQLVRNGIRKDLYTQAGKRVAPSLSRNEIRILVEGPFGVFFKNVGSTLKLARKSVADEIWLLTSSDLAWYPGVDRLFSRIPIDKVAEIYRSCDVIVKLSYVEGMFGPPLEMFHCVGTAIVYDVTGHDEYIKHGINGLIVKRDDEAGVLNSIRRLRDEPDLLRSLKENASQTAEAWPDWNISSHQFLTCLEQFMDMPYVDRDEIFHSNKTALEIYSALENERLSTAPGIKWRRRAHAVFNRLPRSISRNIRLGRYILEGV